MATQRGQQPHVVVTGAGGYIGRHVVTALLDRGARVTAIVRPGGRRSIDARADLVALDLLDQDVDLSPLLALAPDALVHLAWQAGFVHDDPSHMLLLSAHWRLLDALADAGVRLAVLGTMHEVGYHEGSITAGTPSEPLSLYGIAKDALRRASLGQLSTKTSVQWLRAFYIYGDDRHNHSIFTKLLDAADAGRTTFPFTTGKREFDFIRVDELGRQIAASVLQDDIDGIISCCTGEATPLRDVVERFIADEGLDIRLEYGAFPDRPYDSPVVYGDATKIRAIMAGDMLRASGSA